MLYKFLFAYFVLCVWSCAAHIYVSAQASSSPFLIQPKVLSLSKRSSISRLSMHYFIFPSSFSFQACSLLLICILLNSSGLTDSSVLIATFMFAAFSIGSALLYILTTLSSFYTFIAANEPPSAFVPWCVQSCNASPRCSGLYVLIRFLVICPSIQLLHLSFSANQLHILKGNWACIYFLYQNVSN